MLSRTVPRTKAKARTEDLTLKARTKDIPTVLKESLSPDRTKAKD